MSVRREKKKTKVKGNCTGETIISISEAAGIVVGVGEMARQRRTVGFNKGTCEIKGNSGRDAKHRDSEWRQEKGNGPMKETGKGRRQQG